MSTSLFSQSWYRVAPLIPRLRSHVQIHRHVYRGQDWYVMQDLFSGRFHRFSSEAYQLIGLMDGRRSLEQIWSLACSSLGDHMPTQDEVIALISRLFRLDMIQTSGQVDVADMEQRLHQGRNSLWKNNLRSPLSLRIPLFDPDRFLERTIPLVRPLLGRAALLIWLLVVCLGISLMVIHWPDLTENLSDQLFGLENLFLISLVYPFVKLFHEFGHAYMIKKGGGEVHEMGIMLLVFFPIPYVEASSSLSFRDKRSRMLVGAIGIMVELFIAALALILWLNVEAGPLRALLFNLMLISGVSTLLFNGNPLLRFDAYYVFADLLEIPNLGPRSSSYLLYLVRRYLLADQRIDSPVDNPGEGRWLAAYGCASTCYRIFISLRIVLFIAAKSLLLGVLLACWVGFMMLVAPLLRALRFLYRDLLMRRNQRRILGLIVAPVVLLVALFCLYPLPSYTICQGVTWVPDEAKVFAGADGFVDEILSESGSYVAAGTPLLRLSNPQLETLEQLLEARLLEYQLRYRNSLQSNRSDMQLLAEEIGHCRAELALARERIDDLLLISHVDGLFLLPYADDLAGTYIGRGAAVGYIVERGQMLIRSLVPQDDIQRIRHMTRNVQVRLVEDASKVYQAAVVREVPAASHELPSLAFSLEGGGRFALDPRSEQRPQAFEQLFQFELKTEQPLPQRIEEHAYVRFEHDPEPLLGRWWRQLRQLMLRRFSV